MINGTKSFKFVLEELTTQKTTIIQTDIFIQDGMANLTTLFQQIPNYQCMFFQIYNIFDKKYHSLSSFILVNEQNNTLIPSKMLADQIILLKFVLETKKAKPKTIEKTSQDKKYSQKKMRSKERTILEVIQLVKKWRRMHQNLNGKKGNLNEIASSLGISKKSLDDYYYQLKLGQKYGFNFVTNMGKKIGVLRNFIKNFKPNKNQRELMFQKHPKELKIIEEQYFSCNTTILKKSDITKETNSFCNDIKIETNEMNQIFYESDKKSVKSKDNQFYNEFGFIVQQNMLPFLKTQTKKELNNTETFDGEFFC